MTISRGQMPRQLYEAGSMPANVEKMIQTIMEMTGVSREEAIRMIQTMENPQETLGDASMMQEGYQLEPRQEYGLGSIVKSVSKAVKGVGDAVGDFVSSDLGKAALLAAGGYYLGGGALFGGPGFSMGNIGTSLFGQAATLTPNGLIGSSATRGLIGAGGKFALGSGSIASGLSGLSTGQKIAGVLGGSSILTAIFGTEQEAQELAGRDPEAFNAKVKEYTKNLNPNESEEVLKQIQTDIAKLGDVKQAEQIFTRNVAAEGGLMDIPTGEPRMNQGGTPELDYRETGGFVPIGIKEKADDVPAMLSKNEFVFTADAVRGIGDGDVEKGAQILYDNMKRYENRMV